MKKNRIYIKNPELIKEIVNQHLINGKTYHQLSKEYNTNWKTIAQWVYKHKTFAWDFENKTGQKSKNKTIDDFKKENEILKKFLLFRRGWKQE